MMRMSQNESTEEDLAKMREDDRIYEERLREVEKTKTYIEFFNPSSEKLIS